jgi:hypothetical protein
MQTWNHGHGMPSRNITVSDNKLGSGMGISIGSSVSGGVEDVLYTRNYMNETSVSDRFQTHLPVRLHTVYIFNIYTILYICVCVAYLTGRGVWKRSLSYRASGASASTSRRGTHTHTHTHLDVRYTLHTYGASHREGCLCASTTYGGYIRNVVYDANYFETAGKPGGAMNVECGYQRCKIRPPHRTNHTNTLKNSYNARLCVYVI